MFPWGQSLPVSGKCSIVPQGRECAGKKTAAAGQDTASNKYIAETATKHAYDKNRTPRIIIRNDHGKSDNENEKAEQPAKRTQRKTVKAKRNVRSSEPDSQSGYADE